MSMTTTKNKRIFVFIIFLAILVTIAGLILKQIKDRGKNKTPVVVKKVLSEPQIIKYYEGDLPMEFNINENELKLPVELPVYFLEQQPFDKALVDKISKSLGLTVEPIVTEDAIFGETYIYSHKESYLRILPNQRIVDYKTGIPLSGSVLQSKDEEEIKNQALSKVSFLNSILPTQELVIHKIRPLSLGFMGELTSEGVPNALSVSFIKKIDNYPILGASAETGVLHIVLNSEDKLYLAYLDDLPKISGSNLYKLKTFDEIKTGAPIYSSIQSVNNGLLEPSSLGEGSIEKIIVTQVGIAYLQTIEKNQESLQPIFILSGKINFKTGETYPVRLYLSAISKNYYR